MYLTKAFALETIAIAGLVISHNAYTFFILSRSLWMTGMTQDSSPPMLEMHHEKYL